MALIAGTTGLSLLAFGLLDCLPTALGRSVTLAYQRLHSLPPASTIENTAGGSEDPTKSTSASDLHFVLHSLPSSLV